MRYKKDGIFSKDLPLRYAAPRVLHFAFHSYTRDIVFFPVATGSGGHIFPVVEVVAGTAAGVAFIACIIVIILLIILYCACKR